LLHEKLLSLTYEFGMHFFCYFLFSPFEQFWIPLSKNFEVILAMTFIVQHFDVVYFLYAFDWLSKSHWEIFDLFAIIFVFE